MTSLSSSISYSAREPASQTVSYSLWIFIEDSKTRRVISARSPAEDKVQAEFRGRQRERVAFWPGLEGSWNFRSDFREVNTDIIPEYSVCICTSLLPPQPAYLPQTGASRFLHSSSVVSCHKHILKIAFILYLKLWILAMHILCRYLLRFNPEIKHFIFIVT